MKQIIPDAALAQHIAILGKTGSCLRCGASFERKKKYPQQRFCSRRCGFLAVNPSDHNARVARESAAIRSEKLRGRGEGKSYPKFMGRHAHRIAIEKKIGRSLKPGEIVHHLDEIKQNYEPSNLVLTNSAEHARIHFTGTKQSPEHVRKRMESTRRTKAAKKIAI